MSSQMMTRLLVLSGLVVVAAVGSWLLIGGKTPAKTPAKTHAKTAAKTTAKGVTILAVSPDQLIRTRQKLGRPIYWIGLSGNPTTYELTRNPNGEVFVRYLPPGVRVGSPTSYLAIGTYPMPNAYGVTRALAAKTTSVRVTAPNSAIAFYVQGHPRNIYFAYPGATDQVEIFDPSPSAAKAIVQSGAVADAGGKLPTGDQAVTVAQLSGYSKALGQPIYWLGPRKNTTVEFSRTSNGRIYIRYLPKGVALGVRKPYLTIGTYPMANAYAVTLKRAAGVQRIPLPTNSVGLSLQKRPSTAYVAFRGTSYQVEVFDPAAAKAREIVAAGQVVKAP